MRRKISSETVLSEIPKKNYLILFLLFSQFLMVFSVFRRIIKKYLIHCKNISFVPGFRFLYGNIYAHNVEFGNTFFVDYAPIYIGEHSGFGFENIVITSKHSFGDRSKIILEPIHIGKHVWVTARCIILQGVTIGDNSVIAAGSVVTKDIPPNCLAGGNPAKVIKYFKLKKGKYEKR